MNFFKAQAGFSTGLKYIGRTYSSILTEVTKQSGLTQAAVAWVGSVG